MRQRATHTDRPRFGSLIPEFPPRPARSGVWLACLLALVLLAPQSPPPEPPGYAEDRQADRL
ncbi:MAG: hypothetical protein ACK4NS_13480, partial [Saprospiraceae bacterium]